MLTIVPWKKINQFRRSSLYKVTLKPTSFSRIHGVGFPICVTPSQTSARSRKQGDACGYWRHWVDNGDCLVSKRGLIIVWHEFIFQQGENADFSRSLLATSYAAIFLNETRIWTIFLQLNEDHPSVPTNPSFGIRWKLWVVSPCGIRVVVTCWNRNVKVMYCGIRSFSCRCTWKIFWPRPIERRIVGCNGHKAMDAREVHSCTAKLRTQSGRSTGSLMTVGTPPPPSKLR